MSVQNPSAATPDSRSPPAEQHRSELCGGATEEYATKVALKDDPDGSVDLKHAAGSLEKNSRTDRVRPFRNGPLRGRLLGGRITKHSLRKDFNKVVKEGMLTSGCIEVSSPGEGDESAASSNNTRVSPRGNDADAENPALDKHKRVPVPGINEAVGIIHVTPAHAGGINNILSKMQKKGKSGILEESKKSWGMFKKSQELVEDMETHNRGKHGYLERQDFLERTNLRQFEVDQKTRLSASKRSS